KGSFVSNFVPHKIAQNFYKIHANLSPRLKSIADLILKVVHYPFAFLANIGFWAMGAKHVSSHLNQQKTKPYFQGVKDLFDASKVICNSPALIAFSLKPQMDLQRA